VLVFASGWTSVCMCVSEQDCVGGCTWVRTWHGCGCLRLAEQAWVGVAAIFAVPRSFASVGWNAPNTWPYSTYSGVME